MFLLIAACVLATTYAQVNPNPANVPCGSPVVQPHTKRIVNGTIATPGSWPWTVMLVSDLRRVAGSGVIINPNIIVTTAHHFESRRFSIFDLDLNHWRVYAGEYNISTTDPHEKYYHMRRVIIHPGYNKTSLKNDIAIVIMAQPIAYNDHTRPACLADVTHRYSVGQTCYLAGWGNTAHSGNEEVMNQVDLPILAGSVCQKYDSNFLLDGEVCAGYENGHKDWCQDDLGSPLMCKDANGAWYVEGLAKAGGDCSKANEPSIFEDVVKESDWLKKTMESAGYPYPY